MNLKQKAALVIGCLGILVAGCAAASRTPLLQPPSVPDTARLVLPLDMQLGIDIDWYAWPGENVAKGAAQAVRYIESLHANAVSVSFPFFMSGPDTDIVHRTAATPSPAQLSVLITRAQEAGLTVSLRPLLDETSLRESRVDWKPRNERSWFASYEQFLRPYLAVAQRDGVAEFIVGTELSEFDTSPDWDSLDRVARALYHGTLACAANWSSIPRRICGGIDETVDAYPPVKHGSIAAGWDAYDVGLRKATVLTEVGIAAAPNAPTAPYRSSWAISHADPAVQAAWFTAACHAAVRDHLAGIYYWSVGLGTPNPGPTVSNQLGWAGSAGQQAIAECFAAIQRGRG